MTAMTLGQFVFNWDYSPKTPLLDFNKDKLEHWALFSALELAEHFLSLVQS